MLLEHTASLKPVERFYALDAVRGFLALSVAIGHLVYWKGAGANFPLSFILAVDFFFVLSGFVLAHSFYSSRDKTQWIQTFPVRRAARLFPLYAVCVLVTYALAVGQYGFGILDDNPHTLIAWLLMLQGTGLVPVDLIVGGGTSMGIAWAVSIEMWLALLVFMLVYILHEHTAALLLFLLLAYAVSAVLLVTYSPHYMNVHYEKIGPVPFGVLRGLIGFGLGIVAYIIRASLNTPRMTSLYEVGLVCLLVAMFGYKGYDKNFEFSAPLIFALFVILFSYNGGVVSNLLAARPF